ncbi:MAG: penicillin-binding protein activator [Bacteroidota bacterium]
MALLLLIAIACTKNGTSGYKPVTSGNIHVGALLPLTGSGSSAGQSMQVSLGLAKQDIQAYLSAVGNHDEFILDIADTKTDTAEALIQLKAFYDKGIRMVIGPYSSSELSALKSFADSHGVLLVSPSSTAVSLAIPNDNIFRFVPSDVLQGEAMTSMLVDDKIKIILPIIRDDVWGNDLLDAVRNNFVKAGGSVQTAVKFAAGTTDFSTSLSQLEARVSAVLGQHNPNEVAVYMLSFGEGSVILANAKNYTHLNNVYWYGGSAFAENPSVMADPVASLFAYTHGLPCPIFGLDEAAKERWQPLRERIQAQLGRIPEVYAFTAYDATWVAVLTYATTGPVTDVALMKSALVRVAGNYFGATGNTKLDTNGDRAGGNYDFWAVKHDTTGYNWKRVATYNSLTGTLVRE